MFLNLDQVEKQLDKEEFQVIGSMAAYSVLKTQFQKFVNERQIQTKEVKVDTGKALDASLVVTEGSGTESAKQDTSSKQQHAEQPEFNNEGGVEQDAEVCHDIRPLLAKLIDNKTTKLSNLSLKKKTQERGRNSRPSVMPLTRSQNTVDGNKPKPRINTQTSRNWSASKSSCVTTKTVPIAEHSRNSRNFFDSKHFICSTCQKCVFNANHDVRVTKFKNEVNSRAKVPSHKTTKRYKPIEQISNAKKPERHIPTRHRFSNKKTTTVHEKTMTPRSYLRWKLIGRIFKTVGLRWVPTGKIFTSSTTKVDCEPSHCSNEDIPNPYECEQTLDVSAGTLNVSASTSFNPKKERLRVWLLKRLIYQKLGVQEIQI
ncbi:hypothetical protein Tco_0359683 [Tanacetum coccineum]